MFELVEPFANILNNSNNLNPKTKLIPHSRFDFYFIVYFLDSPAEQIVIFKLICNPRAENKIEDS